MKFNHYSRAKFVQKGGGPLHGHGPLGGRLRYILPCSPAAPTRERPERERPERERPERERPEREPSPPLPSQPHSPPGQVRFGAAVLKR